MVTPNTNPNPPQGGGGVVERVPGDWDRFRKEARAAGLLLLEYRLIKARADMKQGSDDASLTTEILGEIKSGEYLRGLEAGELGETKTRSTVAAENIIENAFISGAPAKKIAESNAGARFAERELVLPDASDPEIKRLLEDIHPEIEEIKAHSAINQRKVDAWVVHRVLQEMAARMSDFRCKIPDDIAVEALSFMSMSIMTHRAKEAEDIRKTCAGGGPSPSPPTQSHSRAATRRPSRPYTTSPKTCAGSSSITGCRSRSSQRTWSGSCRCRTALQPCR